MELIKFRDALAHQRAAWTREEVLVVQVQCVLRG